MMRTVVALLLTALPAFAAETSFDRPERGTLLRQDLMEVARPFAEEHLGGPVEFVVEDLRHRGGVAFGVLSPQRPGGAPIPWGDTRMGREGEDEAGYDGLRIDVLYRVGPEGWDVAEWAIGATDLWYADPGLCAEFGAVLPEICGDGSDG